MVASPFNYGLVITRRSEVRLLTYPVESRRVFAPRFVIVIVVHMLVKILVNIMFRVIREDCLCAVAEFAD